MDLRPDPSWRAWPRPGTLWRRPTPLPFSLHAWYSAWWDGYGAGRELRICTVWDGAELAGLLPLCGRDGRLEAMANEESCVVRPLARDAEALRLLADGRRARALRADGDPPPAGGRRGHRRARGRGARAPGDWSIVEPDITSPIVDTTGTLDEYRQATRGKWHKNLRRLYRKLLRDHDARLRLIEAPADLEPSWPRASRWSRAAGSARPARRSCRGPRTRPTTAASPRRFHDRGELRFSSISIDGRMIAWDLGILRRNRLYSPKSGYLRGVQAARARPGARAGDDRALLRARHRGARAAGRRRRLQAALLHQRAAPPVLPRLPAPARAGAALRLAALRSTRRPLQADAPAVGYVWGSERSRPRSPTVMRAAPAPAARAAPHPRDRVASPRAPARRRLVPARQHRGHHLEQLRARGDQPVGQLGLVRPRPQERLRQRDQRARLVGGNLGARTVDLHGRRFAPAPHDLQDLGPEAPHR